MSNHNRHVDFPDPNIKDKVDIGRNRQGAIPAKATGEQLGRKHGEHSAGGVTTSHDLSSNHGSILEDGPRPEPCDGECVKGSRSEHVRCFAGTTRPVDRAPSRLDPLRADGYGYRASVNHPPLNRASILEAQPRLLHYRQIERRRKAHWYA
jgi:hypothetical protein